MQKGRKVQMQRIDDKTDGTTRKLSVWPKFGPSGKDGSETAASRPRKCNPKISVLHIQVVNMQLGFPIYTVRQNFYCRALTKCKSHKCDIILRSLVRQMTCSQKPFVDTKPSCYLFGYIVFFGGVFWKQLPVLTDELPSYLVMASSTLLVSAWPRCSFPVTLGGGITIVNTPAWK